MENYHTFEIHLLENVLYEFGGLNIWSWDLNWQMCYRQSQMFSDKISLLSGKTIYAFFFKVSFSCALPHYLLLADKHSSYLWKKSETIIWSLSMGEYMSDLNYINIYGLLFYIATVFSWQGHSRTLKTKYLSFILWLGVNPSVPVKDCSSVVFLFSAWLVILY